MSKRYFLKKWYFDILTPDQVYVFLYFAFVNLLGKKAGTLDVTIADIHSSVSLHRSIPLSFPSGMIGAVRDNREESSVEFVEVNNGNRNIVVNAHDLGLNLEFIPRVRDKMIPLKISPGRKGEIIWNPLQLRSLVSGELRLGARKLVFHSADGYEDYLYSNVFPLRVPIRSLQWGRIHNECIDVAYTIAKSTADGRAWTKLYMKMGERLFEMTGLSVRQLSQKNCGPLKLQYPASYEIQGSCDNSVVNIRLDHVSDATVSRFLDTDEITGRLRRWMVRKLSKDPRGVKSFAMASLEAHCPAGNVSLKDVLCIDEYVQFGVL